MANENLAYAAGLFDGEGCVYIQSIKPQKTRKAHTPQHHLGVKITMTNNKALQFVHMLFGGNLRVLKLRHNSTRPHLYEWSLSGNQASLFLATIRPFVLTKALEVWLALEFMAVRTTAQGNVRVSDEELALREGFKLALQAAKRG